VKKQTCLSTCLYIVQLVVLVLILIFICTPSGLAAEPTTTETIPARLAISGINLDSTIVPVGVKWLSQDDKRYGTWEVADNEVGWHNLSARLGQVGNTVLAGHSDIKAKVFRNLKDVELGDEIIVFSNSGAEYRYVVTGKFLVQEKGVPVEVRIRNAQWIGPTHDERLTLVTCAGTGATHRLIVVARPNVVIP
jgi:LPXTG-site transpeptidase (sortase) family protein